MDYIGSNVDALLDCHDEDGAEPGANTEVIGQYTFQSSSMVMRFG